jgi:S-methylmethionine-dependent homocysteine/selenocysteine methylase
MAAEYNGAPSGPGSAVANALARRGGLILDGATGTELEARGVRADLPLWSSWALLEAPETLRAIPADYQAAGAEALTAATFRTHARSLASAGIEGRAAELTALAVRLAREAAKACGRNALVLGSAAPLEDCYEPERVPESDVLAREHGLHARHLRAAGVDAVLIETINTLREGVAAARACRDVGLPSLVCFICGPDARLLSGEPLGDALAAVAPFGPLGLGVNCLAPELVEPCLGPLRSSGLPALVYANGVGHAGQGGQTGPEAYAEEALSWIAAGVRGVGGCCGTTPAHIRALSRRLRAGARSVALG